MAAVTGEISYMSFIDLSLPVIVRNNDLSTIDYKWEWIPSTLINLIVSTLSQSLDNLIFIEKDRVGSSCEDCLGCLLDNELRALREYSQAETWCVNWYSSCCSQAVNSYWIVEGLNSCWGNFSTSNCKLVTPLIETCSLRIWCWVSTHS